MTAEGAGGRGGEERRTAYYLCSRMQTCGAAAASYSPFGAPAGDHRHQQQQEEEDGPEETVRASENRSAWRCEADKFV